ncbi:MAG: prepilin-type N-terminal cleavage/methylation domain-containing protein [Candidatus Omnitrophota bacterium]
MRRVGFTLIELLISIAIFTIVIITVYSVFYMGIKTWQRGKDKGSIQEVRLAFLKIEKDLKGAYFFSNKPFRGASSEMEFPLSIPVSDKEGEGIYIVTYSVTEEESTGLSRLTRKEKVYSEDTEKGEEKSRELLSSKRSIRFEYANGASQDFEWQENWEGNIPFGIRVSVEMKDMDEIYNKVIFLKQGEL